VKSGLQKGAGAVEGRPRGARGTWAGRSRSAASHEPTLIAPKPNYRSGEGAVTAGGLTTSGQGPGPGGLKRPKSRGIRRERLTAIVVAVVIVVASAGIDAFLCSNLRSQSVPPTNYIGLLPANLDPATVHGTTNGSGGCSGPGVGKTEYCHTFDLFRAVFPALSDQIVAQGSVVYETTADASFLIENTSGVGDVPFVNVTLLNDTGRILSTYAPDTGWSAYPGNTLPIMLGTNETGVLNIGRTSAGGDDLRFNQGFWGSVVVVLP
jgi:hypothetical protein